MNRRPNPGSTSPLRRSKSGPPRRAAYFVMTMCDPTQGAGGGYEAT
jgi:hypothetical protein